MIEKEKRLEKQKEKNHHKGKNQTHQKPESLARSNHSHQLTKKTAFFFFFPFFKNQNQLSTIDKVTLRVQPSKAEKKGMGKYTPGKIPAPHSWSCHVLSEIHDFVTDVLLRIVKITINKIQFTWKIEQSKFACA